MLEQLRRPRAVRLRSLGKIVGAVLHLLFPVHSRALIRLNRQAFRRWRMRSHLASLVRGHESSVRRLYASVARIRRKPLTDEAQQAKARRQLYLDHVILAQTGRPATLNELTPLELRAVYQGAVMAMANIGVFGTAEPPDCATAAA
jgi:hypothetical protein